MSKTFIHLIFIPIIASLLVAWSYFSKVNEVPIEQSDTREPATMVVEHAESLQQANEPRNYESTDRPNTHEGSNRYKIAELQASITAVNAEISELRAKQEYDIQQEELNREQAIKDFSKGLHIINHTDISEFENSDARSELASALSDFLIESEQARGLGVQIKACTSFGCQLSIDKESQPIAELMRLNRVMIEQGEGRFGPSSLHLVGAGEEQQIMLVWHE